MHIRVYCILILRLGDGTALAVGYYVHTVGMIEFSEEGFVEAESEYEKSVDRKYGRCAFAKQVRGHTRITPSSQSPFTFFIGRVYCADTTGRTKTMVGKKLFSKTSQKCRTFFSFRGSWKKKW